MQSLGLGYGFRDSHINKVIADATANDGLKVSVISPVSPNDFYMRELKAHKLFSSNLPIWEGLHRYYCGTTSDLIADRDASFLTLDGQAFFNDWLI